MTVDKTRRRVLCVLPQLNQLAAPVLTDVVDEWIYALAHHCEVHVVERDFDFKAVCEELNPDFVVFSAVHSGRSRRLQIANIDAYPEIPRALYFNCDPHDPMRPVTLKAITEYGIDTIFCFGLEHLQHMPELAQFTCFVIPKFIDSNVFRDYGLEKIIPVSIFSGHLFPSFYPWRAKLTQEIQRIFPTFIYTHPGYLKSQRQPFEVREEKYAKIISQSYFSAADTTRLDYVVRKNLEIPASGAILLAPESDRLKEYGFADMQNCIMGTDRELYEKIQRVSLDPELYSRIRDAGYSLVHSKFTRKAWTYLLDWYECRRRTQQGEVVRQVAQFGTFEVVAENVSAERPWKTVPDSPMSAVLRSASSSILNDGDLHQAADGLKEISTWIGHIAEPCFLLGIISLLTGDTGQAAIELSRRSNILGKVSPNVGQIDPVEIAWLLLLADLIEDADLKLVLLKQAEAVPHVCIRRMTWLIEARGLSESTTDASLEGRLPGDCLSINWVGNESFDEWLGLVARVFRAHNRLDKLSEVEAFLKSRVR